MHPKLYQASYQWDYFDLLERDMYILIQIQVKIFSKRPTKSPSTQSAS